jgi:cyanate permease
MAGTGFVFYLFDICADRGQASHVAGDLFKTFGLTMLTLQLLGGLLADYFPLNRLLGIGAIMLAVGTAALWTARDAMMFHAFAGLFGGGQGLLISVGSVVWVRYYGRTYLGGIRGTIWSLTVAGSGCGPLLMGIVHDRFAVFDPAIKFFGMGMVVLSILAWWATPPKMGSN